MHISNELRVGIMVFSGLVLLLLLIATLTRWGQDRNTYSFAIRFAQAQGIQNGADVQVAGVKVGRVSTISLDPHTNTALVTVSVDRRVRLYPSYAYTIGIGGLVGERFIEIDPTQAIGPPVAAGDKVDGTTSADINTLINSANLVVGKLSTTADSLNTVLGDKALQQNIKASMADFRKTAATSAEMAAALNALVQRNQGGIDMAVLDLQTMAADLRRVSDTLSPQLENSKILPNLEAASQNAVLMTRRLESVSRVLDVFINDKSISGNMKESIISLKRASAELETLMADASAAVSTFPQTTANLQRASADLPEITGAIRQITPETAENILEVSRNLRKTSETIGTTAQRVTQLGSSLSALGSLRIQPEARLSAVSGDNGHSRTDLNIDVRGQSTMLRLGVADIGHTDGVNAQVGNRLTPDLWLRYGIVQSRVGVGADYLLNPNLRVTGELFDTERVRANALLDYRFSPLGRGWWLTSGWYGIFDESKLGLGVTYRP